MVKDKLHQLPKGSIRIEDLFDDKINLITENILKKLNYKVLADYFRYKLDPFATGEFWGKLVRAGSLTYKYNENKELKNILDLAVNDILSIQTDDGCISTAPYEKQPKGSAGSDLWERKYVMLGLLGYYEISQRDDVLNGIKKLCDYTLNQVGNPPKTPITDTGWAFYGIESSSILEPVVKLYHITKEQRYLDFARYIVESGACKRENLFEAILSGRDPKSIGEVEDPTKSIAKAYEMMSCFEGLIEFYRATGEEKYKTAALKFYDKLIEQEITLLGSGGADKPYNLGPGTGEQWNYTAYEQTNPDITLMMETCVTVTWMKLCYQLLRLTGNPLIADQIEISAYNILTGALRVDGRFFEYFPRFNGLRNPKVNYTFNIDGFDLSCCTANGPTGMALVPFTAFMQSNEGPCVNFYIPGSVNYGDLSLVLDTDYPVTGEIKITVNTKNKVNTSVLLRVPAWCDSFKTTINGEVKYFDKGTYAHLEREWSDGDIIYVSMKLTGRVYDAPHGCNRLGDNFVAVFRGPVLLTRDRRLNEDIYETVSFNYLNVNKRENTKGVRLYDNEPEIIPVNNETDSLLQVKVKTDKGYISMIDYQSAGTTWDDKSEFCSWLPRS